MNNLTPENKCLFRRFRRWIIVQKYTLARGYSHLNIWMLGFVVAASLKSAFPGFINNFWKFILLVILGFFGLYIVGWIDKTFGFLATENNYATENTPLMMSLINSSKKKEETDLKNER